MINFCRSGHNDFLRYPLFRLAEEMFFRFRAEPEGGDAVRSIPDRVSGATQSGRNEPIQVDICKSPRASED
jgi:hypothetical protein